MSTPHVMSTGPKLRDYLPYMTERVPTKTVDPSLKGSVMGMRPNPVGAELNAAPSPLCSPQNIPNTNKTPSDMYRQLPISNSSDNFSRGPLNNYPSSPTQAGSSSAPTYPVQASTNFSSSSLPYYGNNMPKYSNVAPNPRMYENSKVDPRTMYPEAPSNQQAPSMIPNLQIQQQFPQNYSNGPKDVSNKPVSIAQQYPMVSQYSVAGSHQSSLPNSTQSTSHASNSMHSSSYQQPLPNSSGLSTQQYSYAAVSQNQPQQIPMSYQPAQSTGSQVSQTSFGQQPQPSVVQQSQIRPSYQQPQNVSVNQIPQTVYSNQRPNPTGSQQHIHTPVVNQQPQPTASQQHMHTPVVNQQPQVSAVPQNLQTTYPYSQKSTAPTYYSQQNVQPMESQQTNYQYRSPQHYSQNNYQPQLPPSTSQYANVSNVPYQVNQSFSQPQQTVQNTPQSSQVAYQQPIMSDNSIDNAPHNTGPVAAANAINRQPVQPYSTSQSSQHVPGNYSQQQEYQQYHPNSTPTNYQNVMPISQNYQGNVPTNISQQFPMQNQQPPTSNFQPINNNLTKQSGAQGYVNALPDQSALLMQPLKPQICPVSSSSVRESQNIASTSVVTNNVHSPPLRSNQSTPNPSPGPSPSRQPPSSPPIVIPSDSKPLQHLEPPRSQYNRSSSQDLLSSTPENRKDDTSKVLEPKVFTFTFLLYFYKNNLELIKARNVFLQSV